MHCFLKKRVIMNLYTTWWDAFPAQGAGEGRQRWAGIRPWCSPVFAGTRNARLSSARGGSACRRFGLSRSLYQTIWVDPAPPAPCYKVLEGANPPGRQGIFSRVGRCLIPASVLSACTIDGFLWRSQQAQPAQAEHRGCRCPGLGSLPCKGFPW